MARVFVPAEQLELEKIYQEMTKANINGHRHFLFLIDVSLYNKQTNLSLAFVRKLS
jgi:hypothetical protein